MQSGGVESRHAAKQAGATWPQASNEGGSASVTSLRGPAGQRGSREWLVKDGSHEVLALRHNPPSLAGVASGPLCKVHPNEQSSQKMREAVEHKAAQLILVYPPLLYCVVPRTDLEKNDAFAREGQAHISSD